MKRIVHHRLSELEQVVQRQHEAESNRAIDQLMEGLTDTELEAMIGLEENMANNPVYKPTETEAAAKHHYQELVQALGLHGLEAQHTWTAYALQLCEVFREAN